MLGITVYYDTGAGGQYLSGAIAKSLGDAVAPYTFKLKEKDRSGTSLENRNRWFFNTKTSDFDKDKINVFVNTKHTDPLIQDFPKEFSKVVTVKMECNNLWELSMSSFNRHIKNNPDEDPTRYLSDFFNFKRPTEVDFDLEFEKKASQTKFDLYFSYTTFYDETLQKKFCKKLQTILDKPVDNTIFSTMCRQFVIDNQEMYNRYLVKDI